MVTMFFTMGMPRPVPCSRERPSMLNGSKICSLNSSDMPMPLSDTVNFTWRYPMAAPFATVVSNRTQPPQGVYFTAFVNKFSNSCLMRRASPTNTASAHGGVVTTNSWARCAHCTRTADATCDSTALRRKGSLARVILPFSIFEMSSTSLISPSRWSDASPIFFSVSATFSRSSGLLRASCSVPRITFIGVRISWLMRERNSDFAAFAASATSIASFMDNWISLSAVTSRMTTSSCGLSSNVSRLTE